MTLRRSQVGVLAAVENSRDGRFEEIRIVRGVTASTLKPHLFDLRREGLVKRVTRLPFGPVYQLTEAGKKALEDSR